MSNILRIMSASGFPELDATLAKTENINLLGVCAFKSQIPQMLKEKRPDIFIISDKIAGDENIITLLTDAKREYPDLRCIYFAGTVSRRDTNRINSLGSLVLFGIYDIDTTPKLTIDVVLDIIFHPRYKESVAWLTEGILSSTSEVENAFGGLEYEQFDEDRETVRNETNNLFMFTSIKPGTGKSFCSSNVACAIAKYGQIKDTAEAENRKPKVALIEADLQTLSLGTLLGIKDDEKHNLASAMRHIATLFNRDGDLIGDEEQQKRVNHQIRESFVKYSKLPNLDVLVGSEISPEEMDRLNISSRYYTYLVDVVCKDYDVVIVDSNSNIYHVTTAPLLKKAAACYYILNLDYNNVKNNVRYKKVLTDSLNIWEKVRYVLNQDIENTADFSEMGIEIEELNFVKENVEQHFTLSGAIPALPHSVFLNRLYDGTPVVLDKNSVDYTNKAKRSIMKIANDIWPMNHELEDLDQKIYDDEAGKSFFGRLFRKKKKVEEVKGKNGLDKIRE